MSEPTAPTPSYYQRHIFFCLNQREGGEASCANHNAEAAFARCKAQAKALGDAQAEVGAAAGELGQDRLERRVGDDVHRHPVEQGGELLVHRRRETVLVTLAHECQQAGGRRL